MKPAFILLPVAFAFGLLSAHCLLSHFDPPQHLPLVRADFPVCVTIKPGELEPRKHGVQIYPRQKDVA